MAKGFVSEHGVLYRIAGKNFTSDKRQEWINCPKRQREILQSCHCHETAGHLGRDRTRKKITERYEKALDVPLQLLGILVCTNQGLDLVLNISCSKL